MTSYSGFKAAKVGFDIVHFEFKVTHVLFIVVYVLFKVVYILFEVVQILHKVVEKQQLFYLVFADPVPEGIAADAQQPGGLDLVVASFFQRPLNKESLNPIENIRMDILS